MVGDPKQSIFAFTGADIKLYNRVKEKWNRTATVGSTDYSAIIDQTGRFRTGLKTAIQKIKRFGFPDQTEAGTSQAIFEGMTTLTPECVPDHQTFKGCLSVPVRGWNKGWIDWTGCPLYSRTDCRSDRQSGSDQSIWYCEPDHSYPVCYSRWFPDYYLVYNLDAMVY